MTKTALVARDDAPLTPMNTLDRAVASGASIEVIEKLMGLQERWEANQARKAFDAAIAEAKDKMPIIQKNRTVSYEGNRGGKSTEYRHEDLAEIARTIGPILAANGLSYRFRTSSLPNEPVTVTCIISHRDGHSEENTLTAAPDNSGSKNNIQAIGSTVTYLQRYTLKAALGLAAAADDDGKDIAIITEEQIDKLIAMVNEVGADMGKFCTYLGIDGLPELPASRYDEAVKALMAKQKAKK